MTYKMSEQDLRRASVNLETAQIAWKELQLYFASGATMRVADELNLVEVAFQMSEDNKAQVAQWVQAGQIANVTDEQALAWYEADALVWPVVEGLRALRDAGLRNAEPVLVACSNHPLDVADAAAISFLAHARYRAQLARTAAGAVIAMVGAIVSATV